MTAPAPTWAVVFDHGAATASEIGAGIARVGTGTVVLADSPFAADAARLLARFAPVVPLSEGTPAAVAALAAAGVAGITTFSERMQAVTAELAQALGLPYHHPDTVRALTDKAVQRERLRAAGVTPVRCRTVDGVADWEAALAEIGLPAVLKPRRGEGSRGTYPVHDAASGRALVARAVDRGAGPLVAEEYLAGRDEAPFGDYVSVECASVEGRTTPLVVTGKLPPLPPFRETGQFWPAALDPGEADAVRALAVRALDALGVRTGLTHTEIKLTPDGPRVIEVNGRAGGTQNELAQRCAGLDLVELGARIALGEVDRIAPIEPDGIAYQFFVPAPTHPARLAAYGDTRAALAVPGVTGVRPMLVPGTDLPGGVGTVTLHLVCGWSADHAGMFEALREVLPRLEYDLETADAGVRRVRAEELWC